MKLRYLILFSVLIYSPLAAKKIPTLPAYDGEFGVGLLQKEMITEENRTVKASIFYPTQDQVSTSTLGQDEIETWVRAFEDQNRNMFTNVLNRYLLPSSWQMTSDAVDDFRKKIGVIETYHKLNADKPDDVFPVVYFLHDFKMNPSSYYVLIHALVRQGYVVIATHHPLVSACVVYSDGQVVYGSSSAAAEALMKADVQALMSHLKAEPALAPFCDFENMAVIGHGLGGSVLQALGSDEMAAVKAKVMLEDHTRNYLHEDKPTYYVLSSAVDPLHVAGLKNHIPHNEDIYLKVFDNFSYDSFSDAPFILNMLGYLGEEGEGNFESSYHNFTSAVSAFLNRYLKDSHDHIAVN